MSVVGTAVVGLHSLREHGATTQTFPIRAVCPHPGYDRQTMENDLLLLQVGLAPAAGKGLLWGWRSVTVGGAGKRCRRGGPSGFTPRRCSHSEGLGDISSSHLRALSHLGDIFPLPRTLRPLGAPPRPPTRCSGVLPTSPSPAVAGGPTLPAAPARSWRGR